jgi:hypothetical protein
MIATAVLAADIAGTFDLSDTSEVRVRSTPQMGLAGSQVPAGTLPEHGIDLFTRPEAHLLASDRRWDYSLSYAASFIAPDLEAGFTPQLLQLASVRAGWHDRRVGIAAQQDVTYGIENSAYLIPTVQPTPGQPTPPQAAAPASTISFLYSRSALSSTLKIDRRTLAAATFEYFVSGGLDAPSQLVLPQQHGPRVTASVDLALSHTDHLITGASFQEADFSPSPCVDSGDPPGTTCEMTDQIAQLTEQLRHRLSAAEIVTGSAGLAATAVRFHPDQPYQASYFPVLEASYTLTFARGGTLAAFGRWAPYMDLLTGQVLSTLQAEARLLYPVATHLTLRLGASGSQSFPTDDPAAVRAVRGELSIGYAASKHVDVSFGERLLWQQGQGQVTPGSAPSLQTAYGFLAVTVRERTLHF